MKNICLLIISPVIMDLKNCYHCHLPIESGSPIYRAFDNTFCSYNCRVQYKEPLTTSPVKIINIPEPTDQKIKSPNSVVTFKQDIYIPNHKPDIIEITDAYLIYSDPTQKSSVYTILLYIYGNISAWGFKSLLRSVQSLAKLSPY